MRADFPKGQNQTLSEYALIHFNNTHALDVGKSLRRKLDEFLNQTYHTTALEPHGNRGNIVNNSMWF